MTSSSARVAVVVTLAALAAACAASGVRVPAVASAVAPATTATAPADTARAEPPVVQVRAFPGAPNVSVLAWRHGDATYGLRAEIRADGELVRGLRFGEHVLYVSTSVVSARGGFRAAFTAPENRMLARLGVRRDDLSCAIGDVCSPANAEILNLPDDVLRATRDSLVVAFASPIQRDWTLTLRRDVIDAYLAAVDSVSAARRRKLASAGP